MATTRMRDERLGNYRVVSRIGEGGMGTVYRVEHALLGRAAAVKVLQPELSRNQDMVNRFFNEARATAQLQHPGIVDVFDFGYAEDGAAFIVMELLQGESLTSRLAREGRLPWPKACGFARQIASALVAAHRAQIVHRDLKPDNVFLVAEPDQRDERTKVLDFGIAKLAGAGATTTVKTHAGLIMGTPTYMSPQQCRGAGQVDHRADIYSLGCILFEMVCGRPPFVGEGLGDLIHAHMLTPPPPPRQLTAELPGPLEYLILRMLAKAESERPPSMEVVAAELDAIVKAYGLVVETTASPSSRDIPADTGGASRPSAVTTFGASTGQRVTVAPPPRRRLLPIFGAAAAGVAGVLLAVVVTGLVMHRATEAPAEPEAAKVAPPPEPIAAPPPPPRPPASTEAHVLPQRITRQVITEPPGAELWRNGQVLGKTPVEIELPQSDQAEPLTLRLAGYLEQTIEIMPNQAGATNVVLEREPQPVVHELGCDLECEVVLDGDVVGKAAPGRPYRAEFLERKGKWRTYVLRPIGNQRRQTSFRAPADRSIKTTIRLPCAPRPRPEGAVGPRVYDPYDACREK